MKKCSVFMKNGSDFAKTGSKSGLKNGFLNGPQFWPQMDPKKWVPGPQNGPQNRGPGTPKRGPERGPGPPESGSRTPRNRGQKVGVREGQKHGTEWHIYRPYKNTREISMKSA